MIPYISVRCQIPVMGATNTGCAQETVAIIHHTFCKIFMHEICKHFPLRRYRTKWTQSSSFLRILMVWNAVATHLFIWSLGQPVYLSGCHWDTIAQNLCAFLLSSRNSFLLTHWTLYQLSSPSLWWGVKWAITKL